MAIIASMALLLILIGVAAVWFFHRRAKRMEPSSSPVSQASTEMPGPLKAGYWPNKRNMQPAKMPDDWCDSVSVFVSAPSTPTQGHVQGPRPNPDALGQPHLNTIKNGRRTVAQQLVAFLGTSVSNKLQTLATKAHKTAASALPKIGCRKGWAEQPFQADSTKPLPSTPKNSRVPSLPPQLTPHPSLLNTPVISAALDNPEMSFATGSPVLGDASPPKVLRCPPPNITIGKRTQSLRGRPSIDQAFSTDIYSRWKPQEPPASPAADETAAEPDLFTVLYPYTPVESDELSVRPGEMVRVLRLFLDGWTF
ncbi:hypothetical protein EC988_001540, partial [Linderina pennispora]